MGWMRRALQAFCLTPRRASVVILGLDNSGKSTLVNCLRWPSNDSKVRKPKAHKYESSTDPSSIAPTVGFKVSTLDLHSLELSVLDMSGQQRYRKLWECYYQDVQGAVFVVDAADPTRLDEARDALSTVISDPDLKQVPLLILANKMDLGHALDMPEVTTKHTINMYAKPASL